MAMFCRHNRMTARCPICSREQEAALRAQLPQRAPRARKGSTRPAAARAGRGATGLKTRRLDRAPDDGYRNPLVPGLRATADAERLAGALGLAAARLEPPGPYPAVARQADADDAAWLAFLLALTGPGAPELQEALESAAPAWAEGVPADLAPAQAATAGAYRAWAQRHGSQLDALTGEARWGAAQRFGRVFDRLALPGFPRAARYELLNTLGAAGVVELEADAFRPAGDDDPATVGAKRVLLSGDRMLLERRARALAEAADVPLGALDRALAVWEDGGGDPELAPPAAARALAI